LGFAEAENAAAISEGNAVQSENGNAARNENGDSREKRSRDRYGRERGPRRDRTEQDGNRNDAMPEVAEAEAPMALSAPIASAPATVVPQAAPPAASPTENAMPKVSSYALPTEALQQVAQTSGLQWVNSDPARISAVQAAIAAEPKPVHVPRERPVAVVSNEGPLVLVETKKDLRNMTLPFEETPAA
jgi:ribonuclease E